MSVALEVVILYRLYGVGGKLLYVGVTSNVRARLLQHANSKSWWPQVRRTETVEYASRDEALKAESEIIKTQLPAYNQVGKPGSSAEKNGVNAATAASVAARAARRHARYATEMLAADRLGMETQEALAEILRNFGWSVQLA